MNDWPVRCLPPNLYRIAFRFLIGLTLAVPIGTIGWLVYRLPHATFFFRNGERISRHTKPDVFSNALVSLPATTWSVLTPGWRPSESKSEMDKRWRLAGTFFSFPDAGRSVCKAILDDATTNRQVLVAEGDTVEELEIVRIFTDHIVVRTQGRQEVLWLSFAGKIDAGGAAAATVSETKEPPSGMEKSWLGTRVGERRWVINKDALLAYCDELREAPERIAKLYVSMKPNYTEEGRIAGYRLHMVGEQEFFESAGLKEGDIIKKVNSLEMTSQARAEYFIHEFFQGRLNAVVLDIERDGQPEKLIYLIR